MASDFHRAMANIMPIILQQKLEKQRLDRYLKNQLTEYSAFEDTQRRLQEQALRNRIVEMFGASAGKWAEGQPYSPETMLESLRGLLTPEFMGTLPVAAAKPDYQARVEGAFPALRRILAAQQLHIPAAAEDLQEVAKAFGQELPTGVVSDITQRRSEAEARKLGYAQVEAQKGGQTIRAGELGLREKQAGAKVEDMKVAEIRTLITSYQGQLNTLSKQLTDVYTEDTAKPGIQAQMTELQGKLDLATNVLEQKILASPEKKATDYRELIDALKARGISREQLANDSALRRQILVEGYAVTKVLQLWK